MITSTGFEAEINERALDDWEAMEAFEQMDTNPGAVVKLAKILLGDKYEALKAHVKEKYGYVSAKAVSKELEELMKGSQPVKNSKP